MTGHDVPNDEMPNILRPGRRDALPFSDVALAALLASTEPPAEPAPELRPVADVLAALRAGPASHELAGEATALAEFRRAAGATVPPRRPRHRRTRVLPAWAVGRAAAAMGVAAIGLGGLAAAAFVGVLPAPVQRLAHDTVGAPPAAASASSSSGRVLPQGHRAERNHRAHPNAAAPMKHRAVPAECNVYMKAWAHRNPAQRAVAQRELIRAAGGAGKVTAYCKRVKPLPGWPLHHTGRRRDGKLPRRQYRQGTPPGARRTAPSTHRADKRRAHRTGQWGQQPPLPAIGRDAYIDPARHRAVPRSQLGRVGPRHRSEG